MCAGAVRGVSLVSVDKGSASLRVRVSGVFNWLVKWSWVYCRWFYVPYFKGGGVHSLADTIVSFFSGHFYIKTNIVLEVAGVF